MKKVKFGKIKNIYQGKIFQVHLRDVIFPDGTKNTFEYCRRPDSVVVLPFDRQGRLLLTRELRGEFKTRQWFLPAGRVDKKEKPLAAARRELREETGHTARTLKLVKKFVHEGSFCWKTFVYAAKDLTLAPLKGDEHFPIKVAPTSLSKAAKMAMDGTIDHDFIAYNIIRFYYMVKHGQFKW